jgi:hypothetical protein
MRALHETPPAFNRASIVPVDAARNSMRLRRKKRSVRCKLPVAVRPARMRSGARVLSQLADDMAVCILAGDLLLFPASTLLHISQTAFAGFSASDTGSSGSCKGVSFKPSAQNYVWRQFMNTGFQARTES